MGPPMIVPWRELSREALLGVVDEFVLREGTDYGTHTDQDVSLDAKRQRVIDQLEAESALVVFDPARQSVDVRLSNELSFAPDGTLMHPAAS